MSEPRMPAPGEPKLTDVPHAALLAVEDTMADFGYYISGECAAYVAHAVWLALRATPGAPPKGEPKNEPHR